MNYLNHNDLEYLYWLLNFDEENISETRCIHPETGVVNREYQQGFPGFLQWCKDYNGKGNCYVGRSPRLLGQRKSVSRITTISLDIDPIREKGKSPSCSQMEECINVAREIGVIYPNYSLAFTGNGCLLLWTTDKPIVEGFDIFNLHIEQFQNKCRNLIKEYKGVRIDNTQDSQRLVKAIGTLSVKGGLRATRFLNIQSDRGSGNTVFETIGKFPCKRSEGGILAESNGGINGGNGHSVDGVIYKEGSRNSYLTSLAGTLRRRGASELALKAALMAENNEKCNPPLDIREIDSIAGSVGRYSPANRQEVTKEGKVFKVWTPQEGTEEYLKDVLEERQKQIELELPTGFGSIDKHTRGLRRGEIYVVAAHPKCGKTSYLLNIANYLLDRNKSILYFSTEMGKREIWDRLYSIATGIKGEQFQTGKFNEEEIGRIKAFAERFRAVNLSVFDGFSPDFDMVEAVSSKLKPDVVIFDHLQHIDNGEEAHIISAFVKKLKNLAMSLNCAVLVSSQFRRPTRYLDSKNGRLIFPEPTMFDLKGSGTIEQEAAFVLLLHPTGEFVDSGVGIVKAKLDANRFGSKHEEFLYFNENTTTFKEN